MYNTVAYRVLLILGCLVLGKSQMICDDQRCSILESAVESEIKAEISINCTGDNYSIHYDTGYYYTDYYDEFADSDIIIEEINLRLICLDQPCNYIEITDANQGYGTITGSMKTSDVVNCTLVGCYKAHVRSAAERTHHFMPQTCTLNVPVTTTILNVPSTVGITIDAIQTDPMATDAIANGTIPTDAITTDTITTDATANVTKDITTLVVPIVTTAIFLFVVFCIVTMILLLVGIKLRKIKTIQMHSSHLNYPQSMVSLKDEFDYHFQPIALEESKKFISESQRSVHYPLHQSSGLQEAMKHHSLIHSKTSLTQSLYNEPDNQSINFVHSDHYFRDHQSNHSLEDHCACENGYVEGTTEGNNKCSGDLVLSMSLNRSVDHKNEGYIGGKRFEITSSSTPDIYHIAESNSVVAVAGREGYIVYSTTQTGDSTAFNIDTVHSADLTTSDEVIFEFGVSTDQESDSSYQEHIDFDLYQTTTNECAISFDFEGTHLGIKPAGDNEPISFTPPSYGTRKFSDGYMAKSLDNLVTCTGMNFGNIIAANGYVVPLGKQFSKSNSNQDVELLDLYSDEDINTITVAVRESSLSPIFHHKSKDTQKELPSNNASRSSGYITTS